MIESSYIQTSEKYNHGIALDDYNGVFSIVAAETGRDGNLYMTWCYPQVFRDGQKCPAEKTVPVKIRLGDSRAEAAERLRMLLAVIEPEPSGDKPDDDDIPF